MSKASAIKPCVDAQIFWVHHSAQMSEHTPHPASREAQAQRLRALRQTTGLSQESFAKNLGLGYSQWANFESGINRIGLDAALALTREMRVPLDWVYLGETAWLPAALKTAIEHAIANPAPRKVRRKQDAA